MDKLNIQGSMNMNSIFDKQYLDPKGLYIFYFNMIPDLFFMNGINGEKAYKGFKERYADRIMYTHRYNWYDQGKKKLQFEKTLVVLDTDSIIEFDEGYCKILHNGTQEGFMSEMLLLLKHYKEDERRQPLEINLIVRDGNSMYLKAMEIKRTKLDLDLFYEDEFKAVDEIIRKRLNNNKDKGIVLLHGLPGTGKTTYLRHLIGKIKKRVLFLSPNVAGNLMDPDFIQLLIDNPNTVVVIEDAENIIMDRRNSTDPSVSNLLNISDGLLADLLNVQLVCTFNSSLTLVDSALMRKGRLIAKYEFGKLSINKAQRLSKHLGFNTVINRPMTVADISNQCEQDFDTKQVQAIGCRREELMQN